MEGDNIIEGKGRNGPRTAIRVSGLNSLSEEGFVLNHLKLTRRGLLSWNLPLSNFVGGVNEKTQKNDLRVCGPPFRWRPLGFGRRKSRHHFNGRSFHQVGRGRFCCKEN